MEIKMKDVSLPGPHTRMVIFAETVYKLKFKLSCADLLRIDESLYDNQIIQKDIKDATVSILAHIRNTGTPIAVKTRHIVVYPGCLPWKNAVINKLHFSHGEKELKPHPQVIFLLVHIYESPTAVGNDTQLSLGKHLCSSQQDADYREPSLKRQLEGGARLPSARKRLKMDEESAVEVPSLDDSALPLSTEHAQMMEEDSWTECSPGSESVASKPETGQNQPCSSKCQQPHLTNVEQPISLTQRIVRSVMSIFGWE